MKSLTEILTGKNFADTVELIKNADMESLMGYVDKLDSTPFELYGSEDNLQNFVLADLICQYTRLLKKEKGHNLKIEEDTPEEKKILQNALKKELTCPPCLILSDSLKKYESETYESKSNLMNRVISWDTTSIEGKIYLSYIKHKFVEKGMPTEIIEDIVKYRENSVIHTIYIELLCKVMEREILSAIWPEFELKDFDTMLEEQKKIVKKWNNSPYKEQIQEILAEESHKVRDVYLGNKYDEVYENLHGRNFTNGIVQDINHFVGIDDHACYYRIGNRLYTEDNWRNAL